MCQRMRGVDQMREREAMLQAFLQILEQGIQLDISSKRDNRLLISDAEALQIVRHVGANGMKPMNGPRRISLRTVGMRRTGVDDQQLIFAYSMPVPGHFAPTFAFGAIDENHLRAAVLTRTLVSGGFGIVTGVRWQQISQQRVARDCGQNRPWHYHEALTDEAFQLLMAVHPRELVCAFFSFTIKEARV